MEAPKTLRRPSNWQDFESLCKKLWGEIWECPDIQKNGRVGQNQHGVDICGIPKNENQYFGIQCKGKDEYTNKQFTEKEINSEIEKAKLFQPPLKKLYFATTAVRDAKIEEYVRKKNIENIHAGLFEVYICPWEDIVEKIDNHKETHDWYVKNYKYKSKKSVALTFHSDESIFNAEPKFKDVKTEYRQIITPINRPNYVSQLMSSSKIGINYEIKKNLSFVEFAIKLHNTGLESIEDFQINLDLKGRIEKMDYTNELGMLSRIHQSKSDVSIIEDLERVEICPKNTVLVSGNKFLSDYIYLKPSFEEKEILIKWELLSKDYKNNGELIIKVNSIIERENKTIFVEDPFKLGIFDEGIQDYIV